MQGYAKRWMFPNGLGVSIVHHEGSMGYDKGYFECALLARRKHFGVGEYRIVEVVGHLPFPAVDEILLHVYKIPQDRADDIMDHQEHVERDAISKIVGIRETYRIARWQDRLHTYAEKGNLTH